MNLKGGEEEKDRKAQYTPLSVAFFRATAQYTIFIDKRNVTWKTDFCVPSNILKINLI